MKKLIILTIASLLLLLYSVHLFAQSVGIGTATPNPSSQLDISSTTKGILIPRMTQAQIGLIVSPVQGLMVFNTTTNSFQYYSGVSWSNITHSGIASGAPNRISKFVGLWGLTEGLMTDNGAGISLNTAAITPDASAILDISSTGKGILVPRMTSIQRTAIASPAKGLLVFDNTSSSFWFHNGSGWTEINTTANSGWGLNGNGATTAANFIGTTDDKPLRFKINNQSAGSIDSVSLETFFGYGAGRSATGSLFLGNTGVGFKALFKSINGFNNTGVGTNALFSNTSGSYNTGIGLLALHDNITGSDNTAIGNSALNHNTASENTAIGSAALGSNTTGTFLTATGRTALFSNTTGEGNTANGHWALRDNTTGVTNTAIGAYALSSNTIGGNNTASGYESLYSNTGGDKNTANGYQALYLATANENTANGYRSLYSTGIGSFNTASGSLALYSNTTGNYNTAFGAWTLMATTTADSNTAVGYAALNGNTTGSANTGIGYVALYGNTTGDFNTAVGNYALRTNTTGNNNTAIGSDADMSLGSLFNSTAIGYNSTATASNRVVVGNPIVSVIGGFAGWSNLSDSRFKKNVQPDVVGLDFILQLRPVTYTMDIHKLNVFLGRSYATDKDNSFIENSIIAKEQTVYSGFEAQQVEQAAKAVNYDFSGVIKPQNEKDHYSIVYGDFVPSLVKAVQELARENDLLRKEIEEIKKLLTGK